MSNCLYFRHLLLQNIYQICRVPEPEIAACLASKMTPEQVVLLQTTMQSYARPAETPDQERGQNFALLQFHSRLAEMSENPMMAFMIWFVAMTLSELTVYRKLYSPPNRGLWVKGNAYQCELLNALVAGDAEKARRTIALHMETAQVLMQEQEFEVVPRFMVSTSRAVQPMHRGSFRITEPVQSCPGSESCRRPVVT